MRLVFSGSFDPITMGHVDIIKRGAALCDDVIVCEYVNNRKRYKYTNECRLEMISRAICDIKNARADVFDGLLADYCKNAGVDAVLRGVRDIRDFEYEREMALINQKKLGVETILLIAAPALSYVSSSSVRELLEFGADVDGLVPDNILELL